MWEWTAGRGCGFDRIDESERGAGEQEGALPAFYALGRSGLRDYVTSLHPPTPRGT